MKKLVSFFALFLMISGHMITQTVIPAGSVSGSWNNSDSPYLIEGEITIPDGEVLSIDPGVVVEFQGHYKLKVEGTLLAVGTQSDTIVFTINDTTGFSNPDTTLGGWHGIRFNGVATLNDSSKIVFCKLQYGKSTGTSWYDRNGGAIFINWTYRIQISNCLFTNNRASGSGPDGYVGGAIYANMSNLKVENCTFSQNYATGTFGTGGAISYSADTTYFGVPHQVILKNNIFKNNHALTRGGVYINNWGVNLDVIEVLVDGCEFIGNESNNYSGLCINGSDFTVLNCKLIGNQAIQYAAAGGFSGGSSGTVTNCLIDSNVADMGSGGWNSGGLSIWSFSNVDIMNCTFVNNSAAYGGGITAAYGATATVTNSIFRNNLNNQIALSSFNDLGGTLSINHCNIQYGQDSINITDDLSTLDWGVGNMDADPLFIDPSNSDFHLQDESPCVEAAIDSISIAGTWLYCPAFDMEGTPRPNPVGTSPDMGAYETPPGIGVGTESINVEKFTKAGTLHNNFPNPFQESTTIRYELYSSSPVVLKVYDVFGKEIQTLVNEEQEKGVHSVNFEANNLSGGIYFYQLLLSNETIETRKMQITR